MSHTLCLNMPLLASYGIRFGTFWVRGFVSRLRRSISVRVLAVKKSRISPLQLFLCDRYNPARQQAQTPG